MKVQVVFTVKGFLAAFNEVIDVQEPTVQAVENTIKSIVGGRTINVVYINFCYGEQNEQA